MVRLWAELIVLFGILPIAVYVWIQNLGDYLMPILGAIGLICLAVLLADRQFKRFRLWNWDGFGAHFKQGIRLFLPWSCLLMVTVYWFLPDAFFKWPREQTNMWMMTLLIYPLVSVIPQEIIFRTYFFHRYKRILPSKHWRWAISTFAFGLAHLVYGNWVAMVLSWCGGALFGYRYMQTRSTPLVVVEHAMYGSLLFTVGLGSFLVISPP